MASKSTGRNAAAVLQSAQDAGQGHVMKVWKSLSISQQDSLVQDLKAVNFDHLHHAFTSSQAAAGKAVDKVAPVSNVTTIADVDSFAAITAGYKLISEGKLGVLLLAGGQGTRLGSTAPKGCYDIGLPSGTSLFGLQAHRIRRLQTLAAEEAGTPSTQPIHWYIMTSPATDEPTQQFFSKNEYWGLKSSQIHFFQQGQMPCITEDGKLILAEKDRLAWAPDGNGGLYSALHRQGLLEHMASVGIEAVDCVSVDNALVAPGDPLFVGHCWMQGAQCGAKVVAKAHPGEKVGVFALRNGQVSVVEYSELGPDLAEAVDPSTGRLLYNWSNVCMHYFRREFLEAVAMRLHDEGHFHIARKSIPSVDGPVKGIKLELFIFDTFPMASKVALLEAARECHFAPVKNKDGEDSPATARRAVMSQHTKWVQAAGGKIAAADDDSLHEEAMVEVPAWLSYSGEGLTDICKGRTFEINSIISS